MINCATGFLIWVFPTMYISQRLRLGKYLGSNIVLWGIIMMLHAVPKTFGPFFVLRLLLGKLAGAVVDITTDDLATRDARELRCPNTDLNYIHVLYEE
jgi:hypothetical protein